MFSFFTKKKHSPSDTPEDTSITSNPRPEDEYVLVNQGGGQQPSNSLYPFINQGPTEPSHNPPYPPGGSVSPNVPKKEVSFLQGVPFSLSKELNTGNNSEMISIQISEMMSFMASRINMDTLDYDFSVEKSVLLENCS